MKAISIIALIVFVIFFVLFISKNKPLPAGLAILITAFVEIGILEVIARIRGIDLYVAKGAVGGAEHEPHLDKKPKKDPKKHHPALVIALIVIAALAVVGVIILTGYLTAMSMQAKRTNIPTYVTSAKDALTDLDVAKQKGDNLATDFSLAGYKDAGGIAVLGESTVGTTFPEAVYPFAKSVSDWGKQIGNNLGQKTWSDVPDGPAAFTMKISTKDASDAYDDTLTNIGRYKTFGDYDIAKGNQDAMMWIAARLHAEEVYLDALSNSNIAQGSNKNVAYAATTYGSTCYYGRGMTLFYSRRIKKSDCVKKLKNAIEPVRKAAREYASGKAKDANGWQVAWKGVENIGYPISTTGATVGTDGQPMIPPLMQIFRDACKTLNGQTPSGGTKNRLPTTEGGQTCTYKGPKGGTCWFFQTDSSNLYAGGDGDCPELNLMPAGAKETQLNWPTPATPAPTSNKTKAPEPEQENTQAVVPVPEATTNQYPFDGTYATTPSVSCSTPDSSTSLNSDITNFMNSFTVRQSKIYYSGWYTNVSSPPPNPTIGSDGSVSTSYTDASSGATEHTEYSARFTDSGSVSGNLSGYWMFGTGPQTTCSGTFSGSRS